MNDLLQKDALQVSPSFTEQFGQMIRDDKNAAISVSSGERAGWQTALGYAYMLWTNLTIHEDKPILTIDNSINVTGNTVTLSKITPYPIPEISTRISPGTLIESFLTPGELAKYTHGDPKYNTDTYRKILSKKIKDASNVLLAGAMTPTSVQTLMEELTHHGFAGNVDLYDISPLSIKLNKMFQPYFAQQYPNIRLSIQTADLTAPNIDNKLKQTDTIKSANTTVLSFPQDTWDIAIFDVIGTYVSNVQIEDMSLLLQGLPRDGIAFIRDMAEFPQETTDITRHVDPDERIKRLGEFQHWLNTTFHLSVSLENIETIANNLFTKDAVHDERGNYLLDLWLHAISSAHDNFTILQHSFFYTPGEHPAQRYFLNMLVGKRE